MRCPPRGAVSLSIGECWSDLTCRLLDTSWTAAEGPVVTESRSQFSPDYAPEEIYEIAARLVAEGGISPLQPGDGQHSRFQGGPTGSPGAKAQLKGKTARRRSARQAAFVCEPERAPDRTRSSPPAMIRGGERVIFSPGAMR